VCGWPTGENKIAVTVNPGLASAEEGNEKVMIVTFSRPSSLNDPKSTDVIFMDGLSYTTFSDGSVESSFENGMFMAKNLNGVSHNLDRKISSTTIAGPDGIWSYTDLESGLPIIKTKIADGPMSQTHVKAICNELQPGYDDGTALETPVA
jgi:hypothetical protein